MRNRLSAAMLALTAVACSPEAPHSARREAQAPAGREAPAPAAREEAVSAKRFADRLYGLAGPPVPEDRMYAPDLTQLVDQAVRLAARTDDPDLVGNPLCDCQDMSELRVRTALVSATADTASVRAVLLDGADGPRRFLLKLTRGRDGWRLADSVAEPGGSYAAALRRELAER